jgi:flagella basal body P-ring formation protein FlgA
MFLASSSRAVLVATLVSASLPSAACAAARVTDAARAALETRTAGLPGEWQFIAENPLPETAEHANAQIQVGEIEGRWPRARVGVPVRIRIGDGPARSHMVWFGVHRWQEVPVYAADARAGDTLAQISTQLRRLDMARFGDAATLAPTPEYPDALQLKRSVRAGQPALQDDFEAAPAVARRKDVALTVTRGPVRLRTRAFPQKDAAVGELVNVLPDGAGQWVQARVTAPGEVNLEN